MARKPSRAKSTHANSRREEILAAAAQLFGERGYAATGIDQIGAAAGITGGGVYRHFDSKLEIFREIVEPMLKRRMSRFATIAAEASSPRVALEMLVENMIDTLFDDRSVSAAAWHELRHLDVDGETWFDRLHAFHTEQFVRNLRELRPDLSKAEAEARTQTLFGTVMSAAEFEDPLPRDELRQLLRDVGLEVLLS